MALCHFLPSKPFIRSKASFPKQSKEGIVHFSVLESVSLISCTVRCVPARFDIYRHMRHQELPMEFRNEIMHSLARATMSDLRGTHSCSNVITLYLVACRESLLLQPSHAACSHAISRKHVFLCDFSKNTHIPLGGWGGCLVFVCLFSQKKL